MIFPKDVTIIIPHLGGNKESDYAFEQCTLSLRETVPDIRIVVVTNGYDPKGKQLGDIHLVEQGQCKAVNAAVSTVNTPWVFITNDDMIYPPAWFEKLKLTEKEYPCLSPVLVEPRVGAPTFIVQNFGGAGGDFNKDAWLAYASLHKGKGIFPGFNMPILIKKDLWDLVGGYDVNYDPWGSNSDSDLLYKIKLAGVQPIQNTNCVVYHFSQTSGTFQSENQSYWHKNFQYFKDKWGFDRTDARIWEADFVIPDLTRIYKPWFEGKYGKL